ncbi:MAG: glutamyl-tRNA reductase [Dehalococcoidia bacterium]|nr:glutamyl-tRNA reductase [Dehalococcoidia bacterium]
MKRLVGMHFYVVGVNHCTAPIDIRERLAISTNQLPDALASLCNYVVEGIILSTCNRTEIYSLHNSICISKPRSVDFLEDWAKISRADLSPFIYIHQDKAAIEHLFRVSSGLDSMIIGEFEILSQVKQALEEAERTSLISLPLLNLFREAVRVGRRVRVETGISRNALSVSSIAVERAVKVLGNLDECKVLLIGTGEAGKLAAKALRERGTPQIVIVNRSYEKSAALAATMGGKAVGLNNLSKELNACDIVISCTGAPHLILDFRAVESAMCARPDRPLVIVDIAVPRDVEPEVKQISKVFLCDIDDLSQTSELNRKKRAGEMQEAAEIVKAEMERFSSRCHDFAVTPIISRVVNKAEQIRQAQFGLTLKKLRGLSKEERDSLEAMSQAIVQKVLHDPICCLKRNANREDYISLVNELFGLKEEELK